MRLGFLGLGIMGTPMALELGRNLEVELATAGAANNAFVDAMNAGDGDLDFSALLRTMTANQ